MTAHPYLSRWVHDLIVTPPDTAVEVRGAVRADLSGVGGPMLDLFGHCLFGDSVTTQTTRTRSLPPVDVATPALSVVIEPVLRQP